MESDRSVALITPSYRGDFERCRLLCDSVDRFLPGNVRHLILVDRHDEKLFRPLSGARRAVIVEADLLPSWLHDFHTGFSTDARKLWVSLRTWPMRGWHVQQLRRIAIAEHVREAGLLYCDSDMMFVSPFDPASLWQGDDLRLYRKDFGIAGALAQPGAEHRGWCEHAARLVDLPEPEFPAHDYINNLVSWRRDHVVEMCRRIEAVSGRHWVAAIASARSFSECQIYGAYIDGALGGAGHWHASLPLCRTYWDGAPLDETGIEGFAAALEPGQVAIGVQSFTGTDPEKLRRLIDR